jgi:hypothetical protein
MVSLLLVEFASWAIACFFSWFTWGVVRGAQQCVPVVVFVPL